MKTLLFDDSKIHLEIVFESGDKYEESRDGRGSYFFHGAGRGGERQGKKSMGRGGPGNPPSPQCGAGRGRGQNLQGWEGPGRGTYCV